MLTTPFRDTLLGQLGGYLGLLQSIANWRTPTVTEANFTGYAREAISWSAAEDTTPAGGRQVKNSGIITFDPNTGSAQDIIAWGIYAAVSGGSPQVIGLLCPDSPVVGTALTTDTITAVAHGLDNDERVFVLAAPGAVLPTGLSEGTAYYVVNKTTDTFQLSTSQGGGAADITVGGAGLFMPYTTVPVAASATPEFAASSILVQL